MTLEQHDTIDFVAHDPASGRVLLVMVEERPWGDDGARLPDLEDKLNAYLTYRDGQLQREFPDMSERPIEFRLATAEAPGPRELEFLEIVVRKHLAPEGIRLTWKQIGQDGVHAIGAVEDANP